ncbi:MAG: phosphate permease [Gammaproteobacteria bacterium GWE2_42_36]|nr:MAG: phosphate permease [Gammaproteobacteria bacterium GWE2_42_36]HCU04881.1 phosphate permease [Coxiellaceae bacterium]
MEYHFVVILVACLIGLFMAWGVGANDLANVMSTTMGSKAISVRQAMLIAIVFEFAGAFLGGVHVTDTIRNGIINTQLFSDSPQILVEGMLATLIAGMSWIIFASAIGMPVSITNSIIGAIIGFGAVVLGIHAIHWHTVQLIAISWICSPMIAGLFGYFLFVLVSKTILAADDPCRNVKKYMPIYFFFVGVVFALMAILRDLSHFGYKPSFLERTGIIILTGLAVMLLGRFFSRRIQLVQNASRHECYQYIEKLFGILMGFTACTMVFAHGSNDVGVAIGPIIAIVNIVTHQPLFSASHTITYGLMALGCFGVVTGLLMYGRKVIETVGERITALTPSRAFAATLAAASTVIFSTSAGIPVSATQTLVGGVLGVGLAKGIGALNLNVIRNIILSWLITVPVCATLAIVFFHLLKLMSYF